MPADRVIQQHCVPAPAPAHQRQNSGAPITWVNGSFVQPHCTRETIPYTVHVKHHATSMHSYAVPPPALHIRNHKSPCLNGSYQSSTCTPRRTQAGTKAPGSRHRPAFCATIKHAPRPQQGRHHTSFEGSRLGAGRNTCVTTPADRQMHHACGLLHLRNKSLSLLRVSFEKLYHQTVCRCCSMLLATGACTVWSRLRQRHATARQACVVP